MRELTIFGVALVLFSSGCSGSGSGSSPTSSAPPDVTTASGFCGGTFGALVDYMDQKCTAQDKQTAGYLFAWPFLQAAVQSCSTDLGAGIDKGRAAINVDAASTCVDAFKQAIATAGLGNTSTTLDPSAVDACHTAIIGKQPIGGACSQPYECPDGASCVGYSPTADGTCQTPALGEACGKADTNNGQLSFTLNFGNHPDCADGYCESTYQNGQSVKSCAAAKAVGDSCLDKTECQSGLYCELGKCSTSGPAAAGGACQTHDDCQSGLYCDTTSTCAPKKPSGASCTDNAFGGDECQGTCQNGTCVAFCGSG